MPAAITFLLAFQLAGMILVTAFGLAIPEPVVGLVLMFAWIRLGWPLPESLDALCTGLLSHLSLLFVPAAVGLLTYSDLLTQHWLPVFLALLVSTPLSIATGAWVFSRVARAIDRPPVGDEVKRG